MSLSAQSIEEVQWWFHNVAQSYQNVNIPPPSRLLLTDGWGAVYSEYATDGHWTSTESSLLVNVLELKAIHLPCVVFFISY